MTFILLQLIILLRKNDLRKEKSIIEAFKRRDINNNKNYKLNLDYNYDKLIQFRQFY